MKRKCLILLLAVLPFAACDIFLGQDPDTSAKAVLHSLWKDVLEFHAYMDIRMSNNLNFNSWESVYEHYSAQDMEGDKLFDVCSGMLGELKDEHVGLFAPDKRWIYTKPTDDKSQNTSSSPPNGTNQNVNITENVRNYLAGQGHAQYTNFLYGEFLSARHIGYIRIKSFQDSKEPVGAYDWVRKIDNIIKSLENTDALIIDIRDNNGGSTAAAEFAAARFAVEAKDYQKQSIKIGPGIRDFSAPVTFMVKPSGTQYAKPIVLLTNEQSVSAAEFFTLALRTQKHVIHAGTATCGAISIRIERSMINGWHYSISGTRVTDMTGRIYEGRGISPNIEFTDIPLEALPGDELPALGDNTAVDGKNELLLPDPDWQLEKALTWLCKTINKEQ